jgi:hypothetical protein
MQQFYSSISFCVRHAGYLFILCLPVLTLDVALANLVMSLNIDANMSESAVLEVISPVASQVFILAILSLVLSVALSGGVMIAFQELTAPTSTISSPYQSLLLGIKKFFPLLWANLLHSLAYGLGFIMLVFPGFYLYARLGLFPLYVMFEEKSALDSLNKSWQATEDFGTKLFILTTIFLGIQTLYSFLGSIGSVDSGLLFLISAAAVKYATIIPLFHLYFSLYQSVNNN